MIKYNNKELGKKGEKAVERNLKRKGFTILGTNVVMKGSREIDIIAKKGSQIYCIEVKTTHRKNEINDPYNPIVRIHREKRRGIEQAGYVFLNAYNNNLTLVFYAAIVHSPEKTTLKTVLKGNKIEYIQWFPGE